MPNAKEIVRLVWPRDRGEGYLHENRLAVVERVLELAGAPREVSVVMAEHEGDETPFILSVHRTTRGASDAITDTDGMYESVWESVEELRD